MKLSAHLLKIPDDAYTNFDWLVIYQSRVLQADWLILENDEKATLHISMPILPMHFLPHRACEGENA